MSEDLDETTLCVYLSEIRKASFSTPRPCLPKAFPQTPTPLFPLQTCWTHSETNSATLQTHPTQDQTNWSERVELVGRCINHVILYIPYCAKWVAVIIDIIACPQIPLVPITRPRPVITLYTDGEGGRTHHSHLAPKARIGLCVTTSTDDLAPDLIDTVRDTLFSLSFFEKLLLFSPALNILETIYLPYFFAYGAFLSFPLAFRLCRGARRSPINTAGSPVRCDGSGDRRGSL